MINMGFGKDGKGVIFRQSNQIALLTLASNTLAKQTNPPPVVDSFRLIKSEGFAAVEGATFVDGDGPLQLYLASDDMSVAEMAEAIISNAGQPTNRGDVVGNEQAMRPIWKIGDLMEFAGGGNGTRFFTSWSKTIRWTFSDETAFVIAALNIGSGALTTGGSIRFLHTAYGVWVGA